MKAGKKQVGNRDRCAFQIIVIFSEHKRRTHAEKNGPIITWITGPSG